MVTQLAPFVYSVVLLTLVLLSKYLLSRFSPAQSQYKAQFSSGYFQFYCQRLAEKVNKPSRSAYQQRIAGGVAIIITLVPIWLILWLFADLIEVLPLWHGLLLFLALDGLALPKVGKQITKYLQQKHNPIAKQQLAPYVLRDTTSLSTLGLSKACIEMLLLHTVQQLFVISSYFLLFGPLTALMIKLVIEMHYCWNIKKVAFHHFGKPVNTLVNLLQWLPVRLFGLVLLLMSVGRKLALYFRLSKGEFFSLTNNYLLIVFALLMEIKLGGVAIYDDNKLRKKSFNDQARQPEIADINRAISLIQQVLGFYLLLIIGTAVLVWQLN